MDRSIITQYLSKLGYSISDKAYQVINACDDWYRARETDSHRLINVNGVTNIVPRVGFARRLASDEANLCEVVEINAGGDNTAQFERINEVLKANRFDTQYRRQLELVAAEGTAAAYVWLEGARQYTDGTIRGGDIRVCYVDALGFFPLTVENGVVTEAAFAGETLKDGKKEYTINLCKLVENRYVYDMVRLDSSAKPIPGSRTVTQLGDIKPFAVLRTANVNVFDGMDGYGYPKLYDCIPLLLALDMAFYGLNSDIETSEKLTLINEMLCKFDENGNPITPNEQMKRRFVLLGEKLPDQDDVIHDISPNIRIEQFRSTIELILQLLGQSFGFGTKKYALDQAAQAVVTATQYIGERQDMMQELNRQRHEAQEYIADIARAIMWFDDTYNGAAWDLGADVLVEFDDSYISNKDADLESMRADIVSGIGGVYVRQQYLMSRYNLDEAEALKWATLADTDAPEEAIDG